MATPSVTSNSMSYHGNLISPVHSSQHSAAEVEKQLSTQVHTLRDDFREKSISTNQHMTRLETQQAEIKMLTERKQELEQRVNSILQENEQLQHTADQLRERALMMERQCHEKDLQLRQSQLELQEVRSSHRELSSRLEELTEERSLQGFTPNSRSLLYSSMDESSETLSVKDVPTGSLHASLLELRRLTQNLLDGNESTVRFTTRDATDGHYTCDPRRKEGPPLSHSVCLCAQGSRRSDEEVLEEQVRKLGEELRELRELYEQEHENTRCGRKEVLQLHDQVALLSVEVSSSRAENERLRLMVEVSEPNEALQSAIRDRDEAIAKKKAVEMELGKCKMDIMSLNSQLLDAIEQKLNLSQQLEAWQLMDKHQDEWKDSPCSFKGPRGGEPSRRSHRLSDGDKRLFSFFKKN
ncbi:BICD family-like cargo adapter 1 [Triplophysa tibetana]|uniref:BICD family-like cargo adapter 1 n=1 Tax=Triplophysa tibetana TaxID=1572043 RepID=A0A5A9P0X5_9TELE|nr:BICD family-like cargo adapter 1 [Triplophysa tibetana]